MSVSPVGGTHPGNLEIDVLEPGDERLIDTLDIIVFRKDFTRALCMLKARRVRRNGQDGDGLFVGSLPVPPFVSQSMVLRVLPFFAGRECSGTGQA